MKIQFLVVCCAVAVRAGFNTNYQHGPEVRDGVPVDTPEVQAAKELHFKLYAEAKRLAEKQPSDGNYEERQHEERRHEEEKEEKKYHSIPEYLHDEKKEYHSNYISSDFKNHYHGNEGKHQHHYHHGNSIYPVVQQQHHHDNHIHHQHHDNTISLNQPRSEQPSGGQYEQYVQYYSVPVPTHQTHYYPEYSTEVQQSPILHQSLLYGNQQDHRSKRDLYHHPEVTHFSHFIVHDHEDDYENHLHHHHHHVPIITKEGVPEETPEVKAAREKHLLAHHLVKAGAAYAGGYSHYKPVISPSGVPYDTPEVFHAKLHHEVARQEVGGRHEHEQFDEFGY